MTTPASHDQPCSLPDEPYLIAEMACSHDGEADLARTIIRGAGDAGADAIQFQIWKLDEMVVPDHDDYQLLQTLELSRPTWAELADFVRREYPDMEIIACVYEQSSVSFAEQIGVDAYKIHSSDVSNPRVLTDVAETGKRIDLSVGASTLGEIQAAIDTLEAVGTPPIWLMYGYQNFPTRTDEIHLGYAPKLQEFFERPVGYQDHTDANHEAAFWLPAAAYGMGIRILEKHITHDRALEGADHEAALNPDEFARFAEMVRTLHGAKGVTRPRAFSDEEERYRKYSKKSLVTGRALEAGHVLGPDDLKAMRANSLGEPPAKLSSFTGKELTRSIDAYELITLEDVK